MSVHRAPSGRDDVTTLEAPRTSLIRSGDDLGRASNGRRSARGGSGARCDRRRERAEGRSVADRHDRHRVHQPIRGVVEAARRLALRYQRQARARRRHHRRVTRDRRRPRPRLGRAAVGWFGRLRRLRRRGDRDRRDRSARRPLADGGRGGPRHRRRHRDVASSPPGGCTGRGQSDRHPTRIPPSGPALGARSWHGVPEPSPPRQPGWQQVARCGAGTGR